MRHVTSESDSVHVIDHDMVVHTAVTHHSSKKNITIEAHGERIGSGENK